MYLHIQPETWIQLAFGFTFLFLFIEGIFFNRKRSDWNIRFNKIDFVLLLFGVYLILRFSFSPGFRVLHQDLLFNAGLLLLYVYLRNAVNANLEDSVISIVYVMIAAGILQAGYSLLQFFGLAPNLFNYKIGGSFGNPGDLANFLVLTATLSLGMFFQLQKWFQRVILASLFVLQTGIIVLSMARTAWIASVICFFFIFYKYLLKEKISWSNRFKRKYKLFFAVILILLLPVAGYFLYTLKPSSAKGRLFIWQLSGESIAEKPFFGHGYKSFMTQHREKQIEFFTGNPSNKEKAWVAGEPVYAFNDYIEIALEYGLIALALFGLLLYFIFMRNLNYFSEDSSRQYYFLKISLLSILICMLFSYPLQNLSIRICFVILMSLISAYHQEAVFKVDLSVRRQLILRIFQLGVGCFFIIHSSLFIIKGFEWKQAYKCAMNNKKGYINQYKELYPVLKHNRSFLMNYGSMLFKAGQYNECIEHFERYGFLNIKTDMLLLLGEAYEYKGDIHLAEQTYLKATYLVPHKFVPNYKLFKLYESTGREREAKEIALKIRNMKIKVFSELVKEIKTEINEYLLSQSL